MIIRKKLISQIIPFIDTELIKVITGLRRSGKSVLLKSIQDYLLKNGVISEQLITMNFEDLRNEPYLDYHKLNQYLEDKISVLSKNKQKVYLFLDEIQEVSQFEKVINSIRFRHQTTVDIFITGSSAKLLSGELATLLAGRYIEFSCYPFLFSEFVEAKQKLGLNSNYDNLFMEYITEGGMPFLATNSLKYEQRKSYLMDVYNSIVLKDVIFREKIRDPDLLKRIFSFILANVGREFSANSIVKYLKNEGIATTATTVLNYLSFGESAYAFVCVPKYSLKDKRHLANQGKYYVIDQGLRQAVIGRNEENLQLILENIVLLELRARGYQVSVGNTKSGYEIDFIAERKKETGIDRKYFQVTMMMPDEQTREREFRSLAEVNDAYPKFVLSLDRFFSDRNGIRHQSLVEWLLEED